MSGERGVFDVAIIGFGPVGATLANFLGQSGLRVLVLEREATLYHLPRAVQFDDEVMRVFQGIGLADAIAAVTRVNPGMRFVDANGRLLLDWPRPLEVTSQGWHASYRFHQPDLETLLRDGVCRFDSISVRARHQLRAIAPADAQGISTLTVDDLSADCEREFRARWVVGCDGANSLVRRLINTQWDDVGFCERWLVIDMLLTESKPSLGDHSIQYCDAEKACTYVRGTGMRRRWEMALPDTVSDADAVDPEFVWHRLARWLTPAEARIERSAVYTFRSVVARDWRRDNLLIAGDAAHLTPPFMGQGMCAGIRDVANLHWKLAAVLQGQASDTVLDSYTVERRAHVRAYIETAVRLGRLINTADSESALRDALPQQDGSARMTTITPALGPGLGYGEHDMIGRLAPQLIGDDGRRFDDTSAGSHVLLMRENLRDQLRDPLRDTSQQSDAVWRQLEALGVYVVGESHSPSAAALLETLQVAAVLLRPDHYVLAVANDTVEFATLLETLTRYWRNAPISDTTRNQQVHT